MWTLADIFAELNIDPYEVLNIPPDASPEDIKRAYKQIAFVCHPDRNPDDPTCEERFKLATAAYEILSKPGGRATAQHMDPRQTTQAVGPYTYVSFDVTVQKTLKSIRSFRIIIYGAYNAYGLIGSEDNGVAILDNDKRQVLCDQIERQETGYYGPSDEQLAVARWLVGASAQEFVDFVDTHPRTRYKIGDSALGGFRRTVARPAKMHVRVRGGKHEPINEYAGNKEQFLRSALRVAMAVGRLMKKHGFTSKAHINRGGPAVSGEVYAEYAKGDRALHVMYGTMASSEVCILVQLLYDGKRGNNHYINPDFTLNQIVDELLAVYKGGRGY